MPGQWTADPVFHGQNKEGAIARAKRIDGYVILSDPPKDAPDGCGKGYWSDTSGFIRNHEQQVWPIES